MPTLLKSGKISPPNGSAIASGAARACGLIANIPLKVWSMKT